MCEYCKNGNDCNALLISRMIDFGSLGASSVELEIAQWVSSRGTVHNPALILSVGRPDSNESMLLAFRDIHYCPVCGRKLD